MLSDSDINIINYSLINVDEPTSSSSIWDDWNSGLDSILKDIIADYNSKQLISHFSDKYSNYLKGNYLAQDINYENINLVSLLSFFRFVPAFKDSGFKPYFDEDTGYFGWRKKKCSIYFDKDQMLIFTKKDKYFISQGSAMVDPSFIHSKEICRLLGFISDDYKDPSKIITKCEEVFEAEFHAVEDYIEITYNEYK